MEESDIKALIEETINNFKTEILAETNKSNQGLAASLTKEVKKMLTTTASPKEEVDNVEDNSGKLTLKALQQEITNLKTELDRKAQETFAAKRTQAISQAIQSAGVVNPTLLQKVFNLEYANSIKEENGKWFLDNEGQVSSLDDILKSYLDTEEGKVFQPASGVQGSASMETSAKVVKPETKITAEDALFQSF